MFRSTILQGTSSLISNPGATTLVCCVTLEQFADLSVRFPFLCNRSDGGTYPMKKWGASKRYSLSTQNWARDRADSQQHICCYYYHKPSHLDSLLSGIFSFIQ